ncbi:MAG: hypothetical protein ACE5PM_09535 [Candidatus Hydrothermarchaeales archaeon]
MRTFQCQVCKKRIKANPEVCCAPDILCKEKTLVHCGRPMMEIMDD